MSGPLFHALITSKEVVNDIDDRFTESEDRDVLEALNGAQPDDVDATQALVTLIRDSDALPFAERMLGVVLVDPPIPAYCGTLVMRMKDPQTFPWRDHEVAADRLSLFYAHRLWHRALPDEWPPPEVVKLGIEVLNAEPHVRHLGKRTSIRQGCSFVARLLAGRDSVVSSQFADISAGQTWFYDVVWGAAVVDRTTLSSDEASAVLGESVNPGATWIRTRLLAWVPEQWVGDLNPGDAWQAVAFAD